MKKFATFLSVEIHAETVEKAKNDDEQSDDEPERNFSSAETRKTLCGLTRRTNTFD